MTLLSILGEGLTGLDYLGMGIGAMIFVLIFTWSAKLNINNTKAILITIGAISGMFAVLLSAYTLGAVLLLISLVAIILGMMELTKEEKVNIWQSALIGIGIMFSVTLLISLYDDPLGGLANPESHINAVIVKSNGWTIDAGLCPPNDPSCEGNIIKKVFDSTLFDPIIAMMNIGAWFGLVSKTITFIGTGITAFNIINEKMSQAPIIFRMLFSILLFGYSITYVIMPIARYIMNFRGQQ